MKKYLVFIILVLSFIIITNTDAIQETRFYSIARTYFMDEDGVHYGIKHIGNKPIVISFDKLQAIAEGIYPDHLPIRIFGHASNTGSVEQTIWDTTAVFAWLDVPDTLRIVSTSDEDSTGRLGARTLVFEGLDGNWDMIVDTVDMMGNNIAKTNKKFLRLNHVWVDDVGDSTSGSNQGDIRIMDAEMDTTIYMIATDVGTGEQAVCSIPNGYTAYIIQVQLSEIGIKEVDFHLETRAIGKSWRHRLPFILKSDHAILPLPVAIRIEEKSDVQINITPESAANVVGAFMGWIELND